MCVSVCDWPCVCVCLWDLTWGTFSCPGPNLRRCFSCEDLFRVLGKSGCTAVFSVLGMHVSVSFRPVPGSEHCSCSLCVCVRACVTASEASSSNPRSVTVWWHRHWLVSHTLILCSAFNKPLKSLTDAVAGCLYTPAVVSQDIVSAVVSQDIVRSHCLSIYWCDEAGQNSHSLTFKIRK